MSFLSVYNSLIQNEITVAEAAKTWGFTVQSLRHRMTYWGPKLPLLLETLDQIKAGSFDRHQAAKALNKSVRQINALEVTWKVQKPIKKYVVHREVVQVQREVKKKYAIDYVLGSMTLAEVAQKTGIKERQVRRWISSLLMKHSSMDFKDLRRLSYSKRQCLADEMGMAGNLEYSKEMLEAVANGNLAVEKVALERVARLRARRTKRNKGDRHGG